LKISVSLAYNLFEPLTYRAPDDAAIRPGTRVLVPLGRRHAMGWVTGLDSPYPGRLKGILGIIDDPFLPGADLLEYARLAAAAYFTSAGIFLDHGLPPSQKSHRNLRLRDGSNDAKLADLAPAEIERRAGAGPLRLYFKKPAQAAPAATAVATGAVPPPRWLLAQDREREYREACERVLGEGRSVILLVPDNATARYWQSILPGVDPCHSEVRNAVRERTWNEYLLGKCAIVCGGISALAMPLAAVGLLIVDRAASPLYARPQGSPFHLDHLAGLRARAGGMPLLCGSHSHTCASWERRAEIVLDDQRPAPGPAHQVHALKGRERGIPPALLDMARQNAQAGRKTLILVNRILPALHFYCADCGRVAACPRCGGALQAGDDGRVLCRRCAFRDDAPGNCRRCGRPLEALHDISIESLARALERGCGEEAVLTLTAADLKDGQAALGQARERPLVIATLAALNPFFHGLFAAVVWIKPESFFSMEEFNAAEMIHACGAEIASLLGAGGELHVFSVFHFHYALQYLMDEDKFFERELKYRRWFLLPPFSGVYELELRADRLRSLGAAMRELYGRCRDSLNVRRIYLLSRQRQRGSFRGVLELHADAEAIAAAGLHRVRRSVLRRTAG